MKTLLEILKLAEKFLKEKGIANPKIEALELFCDALNLSKTQIYLEHDKPLTEDELEVLRHRLARRALGEPNAYIHGKKFFYNGEFLINRDVLIPRQETEVLVDRVVKVLEKEDLEGKELWDICCGSGTIGITLKKRFPELQITLSDISPKALELARQNSVLHGVKVQILQGDLLSPFQRKKASYVVINPPYISEKEYLELDREVRDFEPKEALVSGPTGLEIYERLAKELPPFLLPHAKVWMEIGTGQGEEVIKLFRAGRWKSQQVDRDWAGHSRFFSLEFE